MFLNQSPLSRITNVSASRYRSYRYFSRGTRCTLEIFRCVFGEYNMCWLRGLANSKKLAEYWFLALSPLTLRGLSEGLGGLIDRHILNGRPSAPATTVCGLLPNILNPIHAASSLEGDGNNDTGERGAEQGVQGVHGGRVSKRRSYIQIEHS